MRDEGAQANGVDSQGLYRSRVGCVVGEADPVAAVSIAREVDVLALVRFVLDVLRRRIDGDRDRDRSGDRLRLRSKYGFSNPDEAKDYFFKSGRGISHEVVEAIAEHKNEPDWMRKVRHQALDYFFARPMPNWGGDLSRDRLRQHLLLHQADREAGRLVGRPAGRDQGHLGQARHPRGREEVPRRRRRPVRVRGRLPQAAGEADRAGRALPRHGLGACASTRTSSSSTSGRSSRRTTTSSRR